MKKTKKSISLVLAILICLSCISSTFSAFAAVNGDGAYSYQDEASFELAKSQPICPDKSSDGISTCSIVGAYPTRKGVILVTDVNASVGNIPITGHAAIIYNSSTVIESLSKGVTKGKNNWNTEKPSLWGVTVKKTTTAQDSAAANWCYDRIGCPYNYSFSNVSTRSKFYCSQLVWASFYDLYGIDMNSGNKIIFPSELVTSSETNTIYQKTK